MVSEEIPRTQRNSVKEIAGGRAALRNVESIHRLGVIAVAKGCESFGDKHAKLGR
jgi:hypothetical protein